MNNEKLYNLLYWDYINKYSPVGNNYDYPAKAKKYADENIEEFLKKQFVFFPDYGTFSTLIVFNTGDTIKFATSKKREFVYDLLHDTFNCTNLENTLIALKLLHIDILEINDKVVL